MLSAGRAYSFNDSTENIPHVQQQSQQRTEAGPDISLLTEQLQGQWHETLNRSLTAPARSGGPVISAQMAFHTLG